jgi:biotin carboxylase
MQNVVILGASHAEVPLVRAIRQLGFRSVVVSGDPAGLAIGHADEFVQCDYSDVSGVAAVVAASESVGIVAGCNDFAAITASAIAEQFGFRGHDSPSTTRTVHLKSEFRQLCATLSLSSPKAEVFDEPSGAIAFCSKSTLPLIAKPVDLTGGKGIGIMRKTADVEQAVDAAFRASREKVVVIEEFVEGTLHSCCSIIRDQRVEFEFFADELMLDNPFLVAAATSPAIVSESVRRTLIKEVEALAQHLVLVDGLVHVQFILDHERPHIIEVCRRPPGDLYLELVRRSTGYDIAESIVAGILGLPSRASRGATQPVLRQCVMANRNGRIVRVEFDAAFEPRVVSRIPLRVLPTVIENYLTEKTEIFFAEFDSVSEMRSVVGDIRRYVQIMFS